MFYIAYYLFLLIKYSVIDFRFLPSLQRRHDNGQCMAPARSSAQRSIHGPQVLPSRHTQDGDLMANRAFYGPGNFVIIFFLTETITFTGGLF